jgi:hypothetical protein
VVQEQVVGRAPLAWYDASAVGVEVPGAAVDTGVVDVALMSGIPAGAVDLVGVVDVVQQVAGMAGSSSHVHNMCSSLLVLNFGHNRGSAWFALPSFFMMLLTLVYHFVFRVTLVL